MSGTELTANPDEKFKLDPEALEIANTYLQTFDYGETAQLLGISRDEVVHYLNKKEVKRFVDAVFLEQGYMNRHTLQNTMSSIIEKKLEEMEETELASTKDIAELLMMAHKMRMEEMKVMIQLEAASSDKKPGTQVNVQNNYGSNYGELMSKLVGGTREE